DICRLLFELRVAAYLERARKVRLDIVGAQDFVHDRLADADDLRERQSGPMRIAGRRSGQCRGDDLPYRRIRKTLAATRARAVRQPLDPGPSETFANARDRVLGEPDAACDLHVRKPVRRHQNHASSANVSLRSRRPRNNTLELLALRRTENERFGLLTHAEW